MGCAATNGSSYFLSTPREADLSHLRMRFLSVFPPLSRAVLLLRTPAVWLLGLAVVCAVVAEPAPAEASARSPFRKTKVAASEKKHDKDAPVLLEADEIGYDRDQSLVIATGNVEVVQGEQILFADQISYNQKTGLVRADGNVRLLQPDGNVIFANHTELKNAMKEGIVENFRARMVDDSVFAARTGRRIDQDVTVMHKAVYSPCKLPSCQQAKEEGKDPMWQLRAKKIKVDNVDQRVTYENARMEFFGVPVFYTPYLSHPTPDADAEAGFLAPSYSNSRNLGFVVRTPYYVPISPTADVVLTPMLSTSEGPVLSGQYRQLYKEGYSQVTVSGTYPEKRDNAGNVTDGREFRGHITGFGNYRLDNVWNTGFELQRTTDDTYMRRYKFGNELTLTSRMYAEGVKNRTHGILQGVTFQGLEARDDAGQQPHVLPYMNYTTESAPGWGGSRWRTEIGTMSLMRTEGADTQRLTSMAGWRLPVVTESGHILEVDSNVRAEVYRMTDSQYENRTTGLMEDYEGTLGRVIPEASMTWRYPLQRPVGTARWVVEPLAGVAISSNGGNDPRLNNEDSQVAEFTDTNVFSFNRFAGYDEVETGARAYYGLRNQVLFASGLSVYGLAGQSYQRNTDNTFPLTSTLDSNFSDYIGMMGFQSSWLNGAYRFRMDQENMEMHRQEANMQMSGDFTSLGLTYVNLRPDRYTRARNEVTAYAGMRLTDEWQLNSFARRNLNTDQMVAAGVGFQFTNECLHWLVMARRQFTSDRDIREDMSIITQVFLKNIN